MPRELAFTSPPALPVAIGATTPVGRLGAEIWSTVAEVRLVWTGTQWADAMGGATGNAANSVQLTGNQTIGGVKTFTSPIDAGSGRYTTSSPSVAMYEMHLPGQVASAWRLRSDGTVDLVRTAGDGVAAATLLSVNTGGHLTATGNITAGGQFIGNVTGNVTGNAGTVTNGVYTIGDQTISGTKTFTDNLGVGGTPSAWGSVVRVMQVRGASLSRNDAIDAKLVLSNNVYRDSGSQWFYMTDGFAAAMYQQGFITGDHQWYVAGRGNANTQVSFTHAMTLDESGNLGVGVSNPLYRLFVSRADGNVASFTDGLTADLFIRCTSGVTTLSPTTGFLAFGTNSTERLRIDSTGNVLVTSNTGGLGYGTGAGGTVTQATNKSTSVTLNRPCGVISMNGEALAGGASVSFTLNNTLISTSDTVVVNMGFGSDGNYSVEATFVYGGGCTIRVTNLTGGSLSATPQIQFAIIKGATS